MIIPLREAVNSKKVVGNKAYFTSILLHHNLHAMDGFVLVEPYNLTEVNLLWNELNEKIPLAVRSTMNDEDGIKNSSAGKYTTILSVKTFQEFTNAIQDVMKSKDGDYGSVLMQPMVDSDISGVMFTSSPLDKEKILIEATYGLGELLVSGELTPETYEVDKKTKEISKKLNVNKYYGLFMQEESYTIGSEKNTSKGNVRVVAHMNNNFLGSIPYKMRTDYCLTDNQIKQLVDCGIEIERIMGKPQDIEWAFSNDQLTILQTRPITKIYGSKKEIKGQSNEKESEVIKGTTASFGTFEGIVLKMDEHFTENSGKQMQDYILIAYETKPEFIYEMSKAKAIVTEIGGTLCHAAIVARELGIPCIVGADGIMEKIQSGKRILVQAQAKEGEVYLCS